MRTHEYFVYMATNRRGTLYTGVTNDLVFRMWQHRTGRSKFTSRYRIGKLVYFETYDNILDAIAREKQTKGWTREKKLDLIRGVNPAMRDLMYMSAASRRRAWGNLSYGPGKWKKASVRSEDSYKGGASSGARSTVTLPSSASRTTLTVWARSGEPE